MHPLAHHHQLMHEVPAPQADELSKICRVMGSPTAATWPDGLSLAAALGFDFPDARPAVRSSLVPDAAALPPPSDQFHYAHALRWFPRTACTRLAEVGCKLSCRRMCMLSCRRTAKAQARITKAAIKRRCAEAARILPGQDEHDMADCGGRASRQDMGALVPGASPTALDLITSLCSWDPAMRPTAAQALAHPYFQACRHRRLPRPLPFPQAGLHITTEAMPHDAEVHPHHEMTCMVYSIGRSGLKNEEQM